VAVDRQRNHLDDATRTGPMLALLERDEFKFEHILNS
jgi:hypothetical protein